VRVYDAPPGIQGVSEISTLILTGNRTHQKEQLFSLTFWRKTLRSGLKKIGNIFLKPFIPKNVKQPDSYEVDFLLYGQISLNFDFCVKTRFLDENGRFFHISADLN
jgi:hypothetical protein